MVLSDQAEGGSILSRSVHTPFVGESDEDHGAQSHSRVDTVDATSLPSLLPFAPFPLVAWYHSALPTYDPCFSLSLQNEAIRTGLILAPLLTTPSQSIP